MTMRNGARSVALIMLLGMLVVVTPAYAGRVLIHAKTSLAEDEAQLCVVPM